MHKILTILLSLFISLSAGASIAEHKPGHMESHKSSTASAESAHADVKKHQACPHCGMDREKFSHSRMLVTYADSSTTGTCSIHCAVTELKANKGKPVKSVEVADLNTKKLFDAEKATWVIGGSKKGVMTKTPKWAFARKDDADSFVAKNGGKLAVYKEAYALAEKD